MNAPVKNIAPAVPDLYTIKLSSPIKTHGNPETRELKLRDPVADDFIVINKVPFDTEQAGVDEKGEPRVRIKLDFAVGAKWLSRLTGHDEIIIGQMKQRDFLNALEQMNLLLIAEGSVDIKN